MWGINSLNAFGRSKETSANFSMCKEDFKISLVASAFGFPSGIFLVTVV